MGTSIGPGDGQVLIWQGAPRARPLSFQSPVGCLRLDSSDELGRAVDLAGGAGGCGVAPTACWPVAGRPASKKVLAVSEFATKERYDLLVPGNAHARLPAYNSIQAQG